MATLRIIKDPVEMKIREEIIFWQRLIREWEASTTDTAPDRMRDALALSMYRLELYLDDNANVEKGIPPHGLDLRMH